jgi:hypothetical protein
MNDFEAEQKRRQIEASFEAMGTELGVDGRCIADETETGVIFENAKGHQHIFHFAPTVGDEE